MSLHGHAKIELTNVKTGEVQTIEHDNMFTNALSDMFSSTIGLYQFCRDETYMFPLVEKALGGIVLMNTARKENPNEYDFPNNQYITGYASNDVNSGTNTYRGSRNLTESKKIENGYRFVWDFNTAQGNGVIASLGLTHKNAGIDGFYSAFLTNSWGYNANGKLSEQEENFRNFFCYNVSFDFNSSTQTSIRNTDNSHITICKFYIPYIFSKRHIVDTNWTNNLPYPRLIEKKEIISNIEIENYNYHIWLENPDDNYYYCVSYSKDSQKLKVIRMNKQTFIIDNNFLLQKENLNYDVSSGYCSFYNDFYNNVRGHSATAFIFNNKIYLTGKRDNTVQYYSYSLIDSLKETKEFFLLENAWSGTLVDSKNSILYAYNRIIQDETKDIYRYTDYKWLSGTPLEAINKKDRMFFGYYTSRSDNGLYYRYAIDTRYLATINNLETPITKTPDQAMKITYTITEVEDE